MKQLNITYEDKEFEIIEQAKDELGMNWRETILFWARLSIETQKEASRLSESPSYSNNQNGGKKDGESTTIVHG